MLCLFYFLSHNTTLLLFIKVILQKKIIILIKNINFMICIRKTHRADCPAVTDLINRAFSNKQHSEYLSLTEMCGCGCDSGHFFSELSLVAEIDNHKIIGHIYLIEISISYTYPSLGLVQVAVAPEFQGLGVGSMLVENAHKMAMDMGYGLIISIGGKKLLTRLGYQSLANFDNQYACDTTKDECLAYELYPGALTRAHKMVNFPLEYYQ